MPIKKGTTGLSMALGTTLIAKLYKGTTLLYENASWELFSQQYLYYTLIPQTINSKSVKNKAKVSKIYGNGEIVNQLVNYSYGRTINNNGIYVTNNADGSFTINGTSSGYVDLWFVLDSATTTINGHKYLLKSGISGGSFSTYYIRSELNTDGNVDVGNGCIFTATSTPNRIILLVTVKTSGITIPQQTIFPYLIDLTLMFGTGNEPTTLTDNRIQNILNRGYIPYNLGEYKGTDIGEFKSEPYNLFVGELEGGYLDANGVPTTQENSFRTKNYIAVLGGRSYTIEINSTLGGSLYLYQYDDNKNFLKQAYFTLNNGSGSATLETNTKYIKFYDYKAYSGWQSNPPTDANVCIHITGTRTGYAPYKAPSTISFKAQLNGAINSHDTMEIGKDNVVFTKNNAILDLGSLDYGNSGSTGNSACLSSITNIKSPATNNDLPDMLSTWGTTMSYNASWVGNVVSLTSAGILWVKLPNNPSESGANIKQLLKGYTLTYPLATPQVITIPRKHLGMLDLSTATTYGGNSTNGFWFRGFPNYSNAKLGVSGQIPHIYCKNYMSVASAYSLQNANNMSITLEVGSSQVWIKDSRFNSASDLLANLNNTLLFYETENEVADITDTIDIESGGTITSNWFSWVENQIVYDGNFANGTNEWYCQGTIYSQTASGNVMTVTKNASGAGLLCYKANSEITYTTNHVLLATAQIKPSRNCNVRFRVSDYTPIQTLTANGWNNLSSIVKPTSLANIYFGIAESDNNLQVNDTVDIKNVMLIDLTQAFGSGNEPTNINDPRIQYIINKGYIPTNTTGTLKSVDTEVLPNTDLLIKCK